MLPIHSNERQSVAFGCLLGLGAALLTGLMLLINGSLVMAVLAVSIPHGPPWMSKPEFSQFLLFFVPVMLVVVEWKMLDYLFRRIGPASRHRPPASD